MRIVSMDRDETGGGFCPSCGKIVKWWHVIHFCKEYRK